MKTSLGGDYEEVENFIIWQGNGDIAAWLGFCEVPIQPSIENLIQDIYLLGENLGASHNPFLRILTAKVVD